MDKTEQRTRKIKYDKSKKMWELQTLDTRGQIVGNVDHVKTKKTAKQWEQGELGNGDCYEISARTLLTKKLPKGAYLCHGTVTGQGPIEGSIYGHSWIEYSIELPTNNPANTVPKKPPKGIATASASMDIALDLSNNKRVELPAHFYYQLGKIRNVKRFSISELRHNIAKFGTWGPWE
jgi:hypothetical protein